MDAGNIKQSIAIKGSGRESGIDLVRTIASVAVILSHYFILTEFNNTEYEGISMFCQAVLASPLIGSDLFMMLTGYLCCDRKIEKSGWRGWKKVMLSYLLFSILMALVRIFYEGEKLGVGDVVKGMLSFSLIPYAWYVEMWIGLFLMAPFINHFFQSLPSRKVQLLAIFVLAIVTLPSDLTNRYGLYILPQYWNAMYPIVLYMAGCYVRQYKPKLSKPRLSIILLIVIFSSPIINLYVIYPTYLHLLGGRGGVFSVFMAVGAFLLFYDMKLKGAAASFVRIWALCSFDIFLSSAIFDRLLYPEWMSRYFSDQSQFGLFLPLVVGSVLVLSFSTAISKRFVGRYFMIFFQHIKKRLSLKSFNFTQLRMILPDGDLKEE